MDAYREMLIKELERYERLEFNLAMDDHWTSKTYEVDRDCKNNIDRIKSELKELGVEVE